MITTLKTNKSKHKYGHRARLIGIAELDFTREELDAHELYSEGVPLCEVASILEVREKEVVRLLNNYRWKEKQLI